MEKQFKIIIEGESFPIIKTGDETCYYPLSFIERNFLKRQKGGLALSIDKEEIKKFWIDFSDWDGVPVEVNCASESVLIERLEKTQKRRLSEGQIKSQNKLHRHLKIKELSSEEYEWRSFKKIWARDYDYFTKGIVDHVISSVSNLTYRKCRSCSIVLPLADNFFYREKSRLFSGGCKRCTSSKSEYTSFDSYENQLQAIDSRYVRYYRKRDAVKIYELYRKKKIKRLPKSFYTRDILKEILLHLKRTGKITENNLTLTILKKEFLLDVKKFGDINTDAVYELLYGKQFYLERWKYPRYTTPIDFNKYSKKIVKEIFQGYIDEYNIKIEDPFTFDYFSIIRKCHLRSYFRRDSLFKGETDFFVFYWDGLYAGYHFKEIGNYYSSDENNLLYDLKYMAEKDMCLEIEKIPLYITHGVLQRDYKSIYHFLRNSGKRDLFYWFNKLYPDKFVESDFTIGRYRNEFDSIEEQQVDGVLREYFDGVIYNYNSSDQVVFLKEKNPDWFIMTEKGVWLVEYFGLYSNKISKSKMVNEYTRKTKDKIKTYEKLTGYNLLFVYPSDLENNFLGLREHLEKIVEYVGN